MYRMARQRVRSRLEELYVVVDPTMVRVFQLALDEVAF